MSSILFFIKIKLNLHVYSYFFTIKGCLYDLACNIRINDARQIYGNNNFDVAY